MPKARRGHPELEPFKLNNDEPYDTLRAQILRTIDKLVSPPKINWEDYDITYTVPRQQTTPMKLNNEDKYAHLVECALKIKANPCVKILVEGKRVCD